GLSGRDRRRIIGSNEHGDVATDEISGQTWELVIASLREPKFDRDILIFDEARLRQAAANRGKQRRLRLRGPAAEVTNARRRRLLRAGRERPRRCAAEQRDERAARHSITSSARASSVGGTSRPSALAVFRLMTSSNSVASCTGRSAGRAPLRIRST